MQVEQLSEMKKKHLKAIKKQDQDIRAKKAVGIWKRTTWKSLSRRGSGAMTPVTEPATRAGSEEDEEDDEGDDEDEEEEGADEDGEIKIGPIRRRSEGLTVDVCTTSLNLSRCRKRLIISSQIIAPFFPTAFTTYYVLKPTITPPPVDCYYFEEIKCTGY